VVLAVNLTLRRGVIVAVLEAIPAACTRHFVASTLKCELLCERVLSWCASRCSADMHVDESALISMRAESSLRRAHQEIFGRRREEKKSPAGTYFHARRELFSLSFCVRNEEREGSECNKREDERGDEDCMFFFVKVMLFNQELYRRGDALQVVCLARGMLCCGMADRWTRAALACLARLHVGSNIPCVCPCLHRLALRHHIARFPEDHSSASTLSLSLPPSLSVCWLVEVRVW
jgi:hypothetical protein